MIPPAGKSAIFFLAAFALLHLDAAYGIKWKPGDDAAVASAYLVSENVFTLRMRQPDGKIRTFHRDFEQPNMLYGPEPWVGEDLGGGMFKILTNPDFKGGRTGFVFKDGHLRRIVLGRKDYQFEQVAYPVSTNSLESLWPKELSGEEALELFGTWQGGKQRLQLGFANPNKAGCLCAEMVLIGIALIILCGRRWWAVALGSVWAVASFILLVLTESRSGLVACVAGTAVLLLSRARRLFSWKRIAVAVAAVAVAFGIMAATGLVERFTTKLVDTTNESDSFRLNVWRAAPKMMVDSPRGWGLGVSGRAYTSWYQPPNEFKVVRTLVNSHLTWLAEFGWAGRFLYLTLLFGALWYLLQVSRRGGNPLPAALLVSLCVAGCFNSVMESPVLWLLPVGSLGLLVFGWNRMFAKDLKMSFAVGAAGAVVAIVVFAVCGSWGRKGPLIHASRGRVIVNGTSSNTWVVDDGVVLGGGFLGKELRLFYGSFPKEPPMGFVWTLDDLPDGVERLVLAGKKGSEFIERLNGQSDFADRFKSILFVSPPFAASTIPPLLANRTGVKVVQGELAVDRTTDRDNPPSFLKVVNGAELYIPAWMKYAIKGVE